MGFNYRIISTKSSIYAIHGKDKQTNKEGKQKQQPTKLKQILKWKYT